MRTYRALAASSFVLSLIAGSCGEGSERGFHRDLTVGASPKSCVPEEIPDNPSCASLGISSFAYKIEPPVSGTYPLDGYLGGSNTVVFTTPDGIYFDWTSTLEITAVIVKGGPNANLYYYVPIETAGSGLSAPINPSTGEPFALSHVEFCFDYRLGVAKTATTSFDRKKTWSIDKSSEVTALVMSTGQIVTVPYTVTVSVTGSIDYGWATGGIVTITNPAPFAARIEAVSDLLDGSPVSLDCGVAFPFELAANGTLQCVYSAPLPDASSRTNVVEVETSGLVLGGSASALVDFAEATIDWIDVCIDVSDDRFGALGTACAGETPTWSYSLDVGPYEACGEHSFVNTASFVTADTGATGSADWTVLIDVPCDVGCTLTPGYWKTHSSYGPAPYDETWALLSDGADTSFFLSGKSYYEVLWTPPARGNAYYILAHAYIAAEMNHYDGASFTAAQGAFDEATLVFTLYTPAEIGALKSGSTLRARIIELAGILDDYDNGLIGPGHCDE